MLLALLIWRCCRGAVQVGWGGGAHPCPEPAGMPGIPLPVSPRCSTALVICCESPGTAPGPSQHASLPATPHSPGINNAESEGSPRAEAFWQLFWEQLQGLECTACGILGGCSGQPRWGVLSLMGMQGWDGAVPCSKTPISFQGGLVALRNKPH